jgi:hypothetical protein
MQYRYAKKLHNGDEVTRKKDKVILTVNSVEVYGQNKVVRLNCIEKEGVYVSLFHDEIE